MPLLISGCINGREAMFIYKHIRLSSIYACILKLSKKISSFAQVEPVDQVEDLSTHHLQSQLHH